MTRAYYASVLGIAPDAGAAEIKAAYRSLVKKFHPDVNPSPGARERFLELKKAYDFLLSTPYQPSYSLHPAQKREEEYKKRREQRMRRAREIRKQKEEQEKEAWEQFQRSPMKWALIFVVLTAYFVVVGLFILNISEYPYDDKVKDPVSAVLGSMVVVAGLTFALYRFFVFIRR